MSVDAAEGNKDVNDSEMEAAFAASFEAAEPEPSKPEADEKPTTPETKAEEKPDQQQATPSAPPPAPTLSEDQVKLLAAIPRIEQLLQRVDKVDGNYGEIKRLLGDMQKAAATPQGAAAFDASIGDQFDQEYPELADGVKAKIAAAKAEFEEAVSKIPVGMTAEQFEAMYAERETKKRNDAISFLHKSHPDRFEIQKTPQWKQWFDGLEAYQQVSLENSSDPYYVSGMLSKFKKFRDTQTSASEKSKKRIENAATPSGVRPTSPSTISDEEAAQRAFEDQFK